MSHEDCPEAGDPIDDVQEQKESDRRVLDFSSEQKKGPSYEGTHEDFDRVDKKPRQPVGCLVETLLFKHVPGTSLLLLYHIISGDVDGR